MDTKPKLEECNKVLVVEGYSDLHFYAEVLESLGRTGVFIKQFNGRTDLQEKLYDFLSPDVLAGKTAIGVIVDADTNAAGIGSSLTQTLNNLTGQTVPLGSWSTGNPKIGLFVTPDCQRDGEVETLVWTAWASDPANAGAKQCIDSYVSCMTGQGVTAHSPDKGRVSALLALRNDDDPRLGPGARAKVFDFNRPEYDRLKQFLQGF